MEINIRQLEQRDLAAAINIHLDPNTNRFNPNPPSRLAIEEMFHTWLNTQLTGQQVYRVITVNDAVAGFGGAMQRNDGLISSCYYNLYFRVASDFHRLGLGYKLGLHGLQCAARDKQPAVALVRANNEPSIKLIDKMGLEMVKIIPQPHTVNQLLFVK